MFSEPGLTPTDPRARARMDQIIGINDCYFFPKVKAVIGGQRIMGPALLGRRTNEEAVAAAVPMAGICMAQFDRLLGSRPYLATDQLADLTGRPRSICSWPRRKDWPWSMVRASRHEGMSGPAWLPHGLRRRDAA